MTLDRTRPVRLLVTGLLLASLAVAAAGVEDPVGPPPSTFEERNRTLPDTGGASGPGGTDGSTRATVPVPGFGAVPLDLPFVSPQLLRVLGALAGALSVLGLAVALARSPDVEEVAEVGDEEADTGAAADVRRAAGRAADRVRTGDVVVTNEVYRAWREMTRHLDVERPESSTPGEFVEAAVDAGLDADDVSVLTRVFEDVRYGGAEVTDERREEVARAFERIEESGAVDGEDGDGEDGDDGDARSGRSDDGNGDVNVDGGDVDGDDRDTDGDARAADAADAPEDGAPGGARDEGGDRG